MPALPEMVPVELAPSPHLIEAVYWLAVSLVFVVAVPSRPALGPEVAVNVTGLPAIGLPLAS